MIEAASKLDRVESIFLEDLKEDYEGLWELSDMVSAALETDSVSVVREVTLRLVGEWIRAGYVRPGIPHGYDSGFEAWDLPSAAAVEKIATDLRSLDRLPGLGEVAWFDITPAGEFWVKELLTAS